MLLPAPVTKGRFPSKRISMSR